jgi:hypothetical protein
MKAATLCLLTLIGSPALSQTQDECLSEFIKHDVCADALNLQTEAAPYLPQRINNEMIIVSVLAVGPLLSMNVQWLMTKPELNARLKINKISLLKLRRQMQEFTTTAVCSDKIQSAFVRLGGRVQFIYSTTDAFQIAAPTVSDCD